MIRKSVPHLSFPFRFGGDGSAAVVEQDTHAEIEQNVKVLVLTVVGERIEVPSFGFPDPAFQTRIDTQAISSAAREWDERAEVLASEKLQKLVRDVLIQTGGEIA